MCDADAATIERLEKTIEDLQGRVENVEELLEVGGGERIEEIVYAALLLGARQGLELPPHTHR